MNWIKGLRFVKDRFIAHRAKEIKELRKIHRWQREINERHNELVKERRNIRWRLNALHRQRGRIMPDQLKELAELRKKQREIERELNDLHFQQHLTSKGTRDADFRRYYRNMSRSRIGMLIFNLILWYALFRFGGLNTGLKVVVGFYIVATTAGGLFEMGLLMRIRERILKPIERLKQGVNEIARGNYAVAVDKGTANEIAPLIEAFNEMARKLKEGEELKAEYEANRKALIANISHDLKTPITSVQGYIEAIVAHDDIPPDKMNKYLRIIYNNTDYMNRLIDDLFLFAKLDMQKLELHFEEIGIKPFFADLMEEFGLDLAEKAVEFTYSDELKSERSVALDTRRFHQVVRNLIDNAVKYGSEGHLNIRARLYGGEDKVYVELRDNGPGIAAENLAHIFERFYRVDAERTKDFASTGLGLAIAKELVKAHGGEITVASTLGEGTSFTLMFPCRQAEAE